MLRFIFQTRTNDIYTLAHNLIIGQENFLSADFIIDLSCTIRTLIIVNGGKR